MEEAVIKIEIDSAGAGKTLADLRKSSEQLNKDLEGAEIGTKAYKDLNQQLVETNKEIKNLELGYEALDNEQQAAELGSVAGAIGDVTTAFILLGGENETLQQIAANVEKAIGVSMAFKGAIEGVASARKLLNSLDKQSTIIKLKDLVVTKAVTAAQWLWNVAMTANPIGLIVAGVGALIAAVIAFRKPIVDFISNWDNLKLVMLALLGPIGWIIIAYDKLFGEEAKLEEQRQNDAAKRRERSEEAAKQTQARLDEIDAIRTKEAEAHKSRLTEYNLQIKRLEAQGKSSFDVRLSMLEDILAEKKAVLQANQDKLDSWIDYYTTLAEIRGKDVETYKAELKAQGTDLDALLQRSLDNQQKLKDDIFQAETDIIALKKKSADKQSQIAYNTRKQEEKAEADALEKKLEKIKVEAEAKADLIEQIQELENEYYDSFLTDQQRQENAVQDKYFNLIEQAKKYGEDITTLEIAREQELLDIQAEFDMMRKEQEELQRQEQLEIDQQAFNERLEKQQEYNDNVINGATQLVSIVDSINTIANRNEIQRIKDKQAAGEQLSKKEEAKLKRDIAMQKAFAVAKIAIDTASSLTSAIAGATASAAATGPAAVAFTPIFIATQVATVLGAIGSAMAILNKPTPSISAPSSSGGGLDTGTNTREPDTDLFNTGSSLLNNPPQKVYVLESDITDTQATVASIEQQASFG